ncbi:hypothetical protein LJ739_12725 [Aestuariibacter halophilus]|uniref:Uncharacterized protein n=1 Tax=Fluctibacter halophilus TaxID=226011 RepID=A0ABS8GBK4_9ALTE|nr:hypothetical protein [Aestuariibacter halophilus]MCC2617109.1 hypothetical protein [Aestuariibacter halophilus]
MTEHQGLQQEWLLLQRQYGQFETGSLLVKLVSVGVVTSLLWHTRLDGLVPVLCLVLWMIDAMWKTFQSRYQERLLHVEGALQEGQDYRAMQFHSLWGVQRPGVAGLLKSYLLNGLRPTQLLPHGILVVLASWLTYWL